MMSHLRVRDQFWGSLGSESSKSAAAGTASIWDPSVTTFSPFDVDSVTGSLDATTGHAVLFSIGVGALLILALLTSSLLILPPMVLDRPVLGCVDTIAPWIKIVPLQKERGKAGGRNRRRRDGVSESKIYTDPKDYLIKLAMSYKLKEDTKNGSFQGQAQL